MNEAEFDIIRRIQNGQVNDYELLVRKYQSAVFNVLLHMLHREEEARELTQDVFVKAYEHLDAFNFESKFYSWIYRIAINSAISFRKKQRHLIFTGYFPQLFEETADEQMMEKEKNMLLHKAIGRLKSKYKAVVVLRYFQQLSYNEIAEVLHVSESKVKSRLFCSRKLLKEMLQETGYFEKNEKEQNI
jgi:RNA polymerase sigma-70 factor, ECF subfamily